MALQSAPVQPEALQPALALKVPRVAHAVAGPIFRRGRPKRVASLQSAVLVHQLRSRRQGPEVQELTAPADEVQGRHEHALVVQKLEHALAVHQIQEFERSDTIQS